MASICKFVQARRLESWATAVVAALLLTLSGASVVRAHDELAPPKPVEMPEGQWPTGIMPTYDVVVQLLVTVTELGEVRDPQVDVSLGAALDEAAIDAAQRWRFEPARRANVPVPSRARVAIRFRAPPPPPSPPQPVTARPVVVADVAPEPASAPPERPSEPPPSPAKAEKQEGFGATARVERPVRSASEVTRDRQQLSAAPHRTGNDLLLTLPGVFISQHGGEGKAAQIFYRGFDADHGQDLEIWVGGVPVNDVSNIHGQGYADLNFVMPEVVRAVHVMPGTYDPRQGDFAVAGSMRFELGYDQPGFTAKAGYGSFGTQRYFLGYRPHDSDEKTFAAAEFYTTDGFGPSRAAQRASGIGQATFRLGERMEARVMLTAHAGRFDSAGVLRLSDVESGAVPRFATYDPHQNGASARTQLALELRRQTDDATWALTSYVALRTLRLRQNFTGYLTDPSGDSQQQVNDDLMVGGHAFYSRRQRLLSAQDRIEMGIFARTDWIEQSQKRLAVADGRVTADQVNARVRAIDVAGYVDVALHPFSFLTLRGGVRLDGLAYLTEDHGAMAMGQARSSQGLHVGPKATLEARILPELGLVASYGEGFRSPQARSLAEAEPVPFTRVRSFEGGVRYQLAELALSLAGFGTWLSDDLVFDQTTVRNERVPATMRTGGSFDITYRPLPWVNLTANTTFTRAKFRDSDDEYAKGDLVPYAPQLVSRADLGITPVLGTWVGRDLTAQLGVGASYLARRPLPYGQLGHDVFLLDAQAGLRFGEIGFNVRAYNLLGAEWYDGEYTFASNWFPQSEGASLVPTRHVTVGAPRTVFASLEIYL